MDNTETTPWYKQWFNSPFYHQLYAKRDGKEAEAFIDKLIAHLKIPKDSFLLDVACGKGRHALHFGANGFDVTGIDLSEDSIEEAKKFETDKLHFFIHDMRLPFWINYFQFAFNFFTSFGYFKTRREHENALRTIAQSLQNEGVFVIDYLNVHYSKSKLEPETDIQIGDHHFHIKKWFDDHSFFKEIRIEGGDLETPEIYQERVAKFTLGDFTEMLAYQEMQVQEVFGNYDLSPYHLKESPRLIIIAKKMTRPVLTSPQ